MKTCVICRNTFDPSKNHPKQECCSKQCTRKNANNKAVLSGKKKEYSKRWGDKYREEKRKADLDYHNRTYFGGLKYEALKRDNYSCTVCGESKESKLIVHHIDETPKDTDVLENLLTMCRTCHAKEHHAGELNVKYKNISKEEILEAINSSRTLQEASNKLGIDRSTLRRKRKEFGIY
jgi:5-methylcytosine-specific restriction endonuclease McrA